MKPENKFKKKILKNLSAKTYPIELYYKIGIPDIYGTYKNSCFWLEFKCTQMKKVNISPFQISWNYQHFLLNPINFYIVESLEARCFKLYEGNKGQEILKHGFNAPCIMELEHKTEHYKKLDNFLKIL